MVTFLSLLFSLILLSAPCCDYVIKTNTTAIDNQVLINETMEEAKYNNLEFNNHKHYLGLNSATHFTINEDYLYYSTIDKIFEYNFNDKSIKEIIEINDISKLTLANNTLFALANDKLIKIDVTNKTYTNILNCDMYSIYYENDNIYLSYILGNKFTYAKIDNTNIIEIFSIDLNSAFTPITLTTTKTNTYVAIKQNSVTRILDIYHNEEAIVNSIAYDMDNSNFIYLTENNNLPVFIDYSESLLNIINGDYTSYNTERLISQGEYGLVGGRYYKIKDFYVYNQDLYILDNVYFAIQKFSYNKTNNSLNFDSVITSSSEYSAGKFYNPQSFEIVNKTKILVADTYNSAIQILKDNTATIQTTYFDGSNSVEFEYVYKVLSTNTNYYVLQKTDLNACEILILDFDFNLVEKVNHNLNKICDIEIINDVLHIIDAETNKIYAYSNSSLISAFDSLVTFTINENSKLDYIQENNTLLILCDNVLYVLNITENTLTQIDLPSNSTAISHDFYKSIYVLSQNAIYKYENLVLTKTETLNTNYSAFNIEKEDGKIYLFNNTNQNFVTYKNLEFVNSLNENYSHPVDLPSYLSNDIVKIARTKENVYVYEYPFKNGLNYNLTNKNVYILNEDTFNDYYYVCFNNVDENNFRTLSAGYILKSDVEVLSYSTLGISETFTVITKTKLYSLPTLLTYNGNNLFVGELNVGETVRTTYVKLTNNEYTIDNCNFYIVEYNDIIAYVKDIDVLSSKVNHVEEILKTNAKLVVSEDKYNSVYIYAGNSSFVVGKLLVGKRIYVENYDINSKYTLIKYLDEENHEHSGYILTKCIKMDNDKDTNISAIILITLSIIALISVTTFYIFTYKKQQKQIEETGTIIDINSNIVLRKPKGKIPKDIQKLSGKEKLNNKNINEDVDNKE